MVSIGVKCEKHAEGIRWMSSAVSVRFGDLTVITIRKSLINMRKRLTKHNQKKDVLPLHLIKAV